MLQPTTSVCVMEAEHQNKKRVRDDSGESEVLYSPEAKRIRDDLFGLLDDYSYPDPVIHDLDSVMKSLQKELSAPCSPVSFVDLTSDSGEPRPEFGYLLEASDDELGLPPPGESVKEQKGKNGQDAELFGVSSETPGIGELWDFEDNIPSYESYDSYALGFGDNYGDGGGSEYLALDGLFEQSDIYYGTPDFSGSWRHESLPAQ